MALGEVGLDFNGRISPREKAVQRDVLKELLYIAEAGASGKSRDGGPERSPATGDSLLLQFYFIQDGGV